MRFAPRRPIPTFVQTPPVSAYLAGRHALSAVLQDKRAQLGRNVGLPFRRDEANPQAAQLFFDL